MTAPNLGRVLIVDDEVELMTALCESLTDQNHLPPAKRVV
jgi:hypothetical protein